MSTNPSDERRAGGRRKEPTSAIRAFHVPSNDFLGHIQDLSQTGMCLVCDLDQPAVGSIAEFRIQGPGLEPVCANVKGTIRWLEKSNHDGFHTIGVEFDLHLATADSEALAKLAVLLCR